MAQPLPLFLLRSMNYRLDGNRRPCEFTPRKRAKNRRVEHPRIFKSQLVLPPFLLYSCDFFRPWRFSLKKVHPGSIRLPRTCRHNSFLVQLGISIFPLHFAVRNKYEIHAPSLFSLLWARDFARHS